MGNKITVDSATLANKALEVIEAHFLFGLPYDQIDVVVHPQSIVHAFVEFCDGSVLAQVGFPSMELPILYALTHPDRLADPGTRRFDPVAAGPLTFEPVRDGRFRAFHAWASRRAARAALRRRCSMPPTRRRWPRSSTGSDALRADRRGHRSACSSDTRRSRCATSRPSVRADRGRAPGTGALLVGIHASHRARAGRRPRRAHLRARARSFPRRQVGRHLGAPLLARHRHADPRRSRSSAGETEYSICRGSRSAAT